VPGPEKCLGRKEQPDHKTGCIRLGFRLSSKQWEPQRPYNREKYDKAFSRD
jgi:hypothetical protein